MAPKGERNPPPSGGGGDAEFAVMEPPAPTPLEEAAVRSELAARHRGDVLDADDEEETTPVLTGVTSNNKGNILEAAFVDPAYSWPPEDGKGLNAIELQASLNMLTNDETDSQFTTESQAARMAHPDKPVPQAKQGWFSCCSSKEAVVTPEQMRAYQEQKLSAKQARQQHKLSKQEYTKTKEKLLRRQEKYNRVPEGILIYRLDTSDRTLQLLSPPHDKTNMTTLVEACIVDRAEAADSSRRSIRVTDIDGNEFILTACEQRTATAWLEAIGLMDAKHSSKRGGFFGGKKVRQHRLCVLNGVDAILNLYSLTHSLTHSIMLSLSVSVRSSPTLGARKNSKIPSSTPLKTST